MTAVGEGGDGRRRVDGALRHRNVPWRALDDKLVVARPSDGAPVVLAPTAALVWRHLDRWTSADEIDHRLAEVFPEVPADEREAARASILVALTDDDLVERA
jgi:hypothetical protein